jgi:hypothetical protein
MVKVVALMDVLLAMSLLSGEVGPPRPAYAPDWNEADR